MMSGGWVKKCFLSLRQTALLSAEGKKSWGECVPDHESRKYYQIG
jgi:hypothetical protein